MTWMLHTGDCRQVLASLDECSVDACVTDPPHELGFMGKKWDCSGVAFDVETWRAVLRVLKPGAHLLAFSGTRTYHRMVCAIEDAGFEIRDSIHWIYGTGFPKSLNVGKAIDAALGAEREIVGVRPIAYPDSPSGYTSVSANSTARGGGIWNPVTGQTEHGRPVTAPATDAAKQWEGWGTALKPGHEPIVLARKPLDGTVAANVQRWSTGAINIDGCRINPGETVRGGGNGQANNGGRFGARETNGTRPIVEPHADGRWPANVILDEDAAAELDAQSGTCTSGKAPGGLKRNVDKFRNTYSSFAGQRTEDDPTYGDTGGASRFFYVVKPTRKERDAGLDHIAAKSAGEATDRKDGSAGLNSPRAGAGRTSGARNHHPTVKPVELMRYLVRLVTPPNGLVLDPFTGSGTTGIATLQEGFRFIGIDLDPEYARIAIARIEEDAPLFNRKRGA